MPKVVVPPRPMTPDFASGSLPQGVSPPLRGLTAAFHQDTPGSTQSAADAIKGLQSGWNGVTSSLQDEMAPQESIDKKAKLYAGGPTNATYVPHR